MEEPAEAPYAHWLSDFVMDEKPPLIGALAADKISCGRLSNVIVVPVTSSVQYVRADVLEKADARIAELTAALDQANARIAALEAKPVELEGDPDWRMPSTHFPRYF